MIPKIPLALHVCDILTCPPSKREEGIRDTPAAKYLPGKEEHSVNCPRRPICSSQDCGQDHVISNLSGMLSLSSPRGSEIPLPPAVSSMGSQQVLQGLLLSQRGPPHRVLSPPTCSLTYIHPVLKAVPSSPSQEEKSEGLSSPSKCLLMGLMINSPFRIFNLIIFSRIPNL